MKYVFFWVIPRRRSSKSRRFGTLYRFHLQGPLKMEPIEGSETSAFRTPTPGNYPKENILHKEHGESLKSRKLSTLPDDGDHTETCCSYCNFDVNFNTL